MDPAFAFAQLLTGLASASSLFLIASGLTIIFGVTRIVNFAHGSLYMLGAYCAYSFSGSLTGAFGGAIGFWGGVVLAAIAVGLLGVLMEVLLLRRIYRAPELFQLLATFGVVLLVQDMVVALWGPEDLLGPRAPGLKSFATVFGQRFPEYELFMIGIGPVVLAGLWLLFHRTRWGALVRAATEDREMVGALGIRQSALFTGVVFLGAFLAGLAGALQIPRGPAAPFMDVAVIAEAFVVTVVGGMGSVTGAFLAAIVIGVLQAFGILAFPKITLVLVFLVMAVVLTIRPWGLLGKPEAPRGEPYGEDAPLTPLGKPGRAAALLVAASLLCLPAALPEYGLILAIEAFIMALFAMSLGFLMGNGGVISFGHAAYFGLGAYGAALMVKHFEAPMETALIAAPVAAAVGGLLFGWFVVRLSGVYLAMLTLAFAQIAWSVAFQWWEVTGGDNGIVGVWPSAWAKDRVVFYYLTLAVCGAGVACLWRITFAPFGYAMRAGRDSPLRADAIGIDLRTQRWLGFALAATMAGVAGGLFAFSKGNIDPEVLAIPTSVDALAMVLMGGIQTVAGPLVGGAGFPLLKAWAQPLTDFWRLILGGAIIALVLAFPLGVVGFARRLFLRHSAKRQDAEPAE